MKLETFIFDFDGTLADTLPICIGSFRKALEKNLGRPFSEEEIVARFGLDEEGILRRLAPHCWEKCMEDFLAAYEESHEGLTPFPGVVELLEDLKARGARLALVTGKGGPSAEISLGRLDLARFFDAIEVGSPERNIKSECIRRLLEETGVSPARAAYVGDAPSDMDSAREAEVVPVAAAWASSADPEALRQKNPAHLFTSLEEFGHWARRTLDAGARSQA